MIRVVTALDLETHPIFASFLAVVVDAALHEGVRPATDPPGQWMRLVTVLEMRTALAQRYEGFTGGP